MKEVELEVYDPTGAMEITETFAPRLADLNGKTICEVWAAWQANRTFPVIEEALKKQFPTAKFVRFTEFGGGRAEGTEADIDLLVKTGCDGVITGNAG